MPPVRRDDLIRCFRNKLNGEIARDTEHTHYEFRLRGQVVATTKVSPPSKYRDFGDHVLGLIAKHLHVPSGWLRKSAECDDEATRDILLRWEQLR